MGARITGSEAFVKSLQVEETKHVFGIVGSAFMDALDLFPEANINFVGVRHEQSAAHMADAYARLLRKPGVCLVQNGPGATNLVTGVAAAYHAHSPVFAITGSPLSSQLQTNAYQEADHVAIFKSITKYSVQVNRPDRIPEFFRNCFRQAMGSPHGPVHLDVPRDFFYDLIETDIYLPPNYRTQGVVGPTQHEISTVASMLDAARSPFIIAGGGVLWSDGVEEVVKLAEALSAPVATSYGHNDAFPNRHPLFIGALGRGGSKAAMDLCSKSDLVLAVGTKLGQFTTLEYYGFPYFLPNSRVIQIDVDPNQIGKYRPVSLGIVSDAKLFLQSINSHFNKLPRMLNSARISEVERSRGSWESEMTSLWKSSNSKLMKPQRAYHEISEALPEDCVVTLDLGSLTGFAYSMLSFPRPLSFIAPLGFGNVGFGYPAGLGAKIACPERKVVSILGDGAFSMSVHEVMTAVQEKLPTVCLILNNFAWGAEKANQMHFYDARYIGTNLINPDFAKVAEAMGARGVRVENPSEIRQAMKSAFESDSPFVIDILVDPLELSLPARRDALKKPIRTGALTASKQLTTT